MFQEQLNKMCERSLVAELTVKIQGFTEFSIGFHRYPEYERLIQMVRDIEQMHANCRELEITYLQIGPSQITGEIVVEAYNYWTQD